MRLERGSAQVVLRRIRPFSSIVKNGPKRGDGGRERDDEQIVDSNRVCGVLITICCHHHIWVVGADLNLLVAILASSGQVPFPGRVCQPLKHHTHPPSVLRLGLRGDPP